jgi:hypothetical protein
MRIREPASTDVSIAILGPLTATRGGTQIVIGPARQRSVLGLLVPCQPVGISANGLVEVLWGERPPPIQYTHIVALPWMSESL